MKPTRNRATNGHGPGVGRGCKPRQNSADVLTIEPALLSLRGGDTHEHCIGIEDSFPRQAESDVVPYHLVIERQRVAERVPYRAEPYDPDRGLRLPLWSSIVHPPIPLARGIPASRIPCGTRGDNPRIASWGLSSALYKSIRNELGVRRKL